ncbi:hypothetical protein ASPVEDRAFT_33917 [Aspergillus versicolor CBS 583.65]|uniref:F-box domain-containing protein n=1 Tax=Aspergillus versicolor CBS 583.65 TaxID=1036611 RepID=A0A1L9Q1T5_ASPVE|nr:uncharacterized protein ASPVEDRAFT_33917 [Aspergillus versicolor CBS 583.65]OJJ07720.1 hypothetical protein ASPVEDRAFT_33917 [Aspergillus versicolor CBS 583.65]
MLLRLPTEILCLLADFIDNIETFTNAAATCRRLRDALYAAPPQTILRLAAASAPTFFSPHPHFLVLATARTASNWALGDADRVDELRSALQGGIDGFYHFCLRHSGLTLADIRRTHRARFSIINPLSDKIDKMAGRQWYSTPRFWDGGVSEAYTLETEADRATFQLLIYSEMFASTMEAFLEPERGLPLHDLTTRLTYITYCIPDWGCRSYSGFDVLPTGPYADGDASEADQVAFHHILSCWRWGCLWGDAIRTLLFENPASFPQRRRDDEEDGRQKLLRDALQVQGLEGMQLVTLPKDQISPAALERAMAIKARVLQVPHLPAVTTFGTRRNITVASHAPDPAKEVRVCCGSFWGM